MSENTEFLTQNARFICKHLQQKSSSDNTFLTQHQQLVVYLHLDLWKKSKEKEKKNIIKINLVLEFCRIIWINYNVNEDISQQSGYGCLYKSIQFNIYSSKFTHTNISYVLQVNLCQKLFFLQNIGRTCCVQKLFWMSDNFCTLSPGLRLEFSCIDLVIQWTICCHIVG